MAIPASVLPDAVAWTIKQGSTFVKEFVWAEDDEVTPIGDFTGWTAELQLRHTTDISDAPDLIIKTTPGVGQGTIVIDGPAAKFTVTIPADLSAALTRLSYIGDLEITNPTPNPDVILTPLEISFTVRQNYTQPVGDEVILT